MRIGGLQPSSLIDYPGTISAVIFTVGCNFRCPYCHNPELVLETTEVPLPQEDILAFLKERAGVLPAVTVTGGEPTMQEDLLDFLREVKALGFKVKLDTNGTNTAVLAEVVARGLVDYVAMDIKAPLAKYAEVVCAAVSGEEIRKSIAFLLEGRVPYEFRTTVVKSLLAPEDLRTMMREIEGAENYYLQQFSSAKTLHPAFRRALTYTKEELRVLALEAGAFVRHCHVRA